MTNHSDTPLLRAERTVDYIVRTRGQSSAEYFQALRDYQSLLHRSMAAAEMEEALSEPERSVVQAPALKRPA
ncbi:MAG TPA: hypothetical protein VGP72_17740 [Planctomycetota bacterium]|jgi:hypothetical protein